MSQPIPEPPRLSPWLWLYLPLLAAAGLLLFAFLDLQGPWLYSEQGVIELVQFVILVVATVIGIRLLTRVRTPRWLWAWFALATIGAAYSAGEEVSWGQQLIGWETPAWVGEINDQNETNLHNTSSWFDQKPRAVLELGVIAGGIVLPLVSRNVVSLAARPWWVLVPSTEMLPTAVLAELSRLGSGWYHRLGLGESVLFARAKEVQELYFYWFVLLYLLQARRRFAP